MKISDNDSSGIPFENTKSLKLYKEIARKSYTEWT